MLSVVAMMILLVHLMLILLPAFSDTNSDPSDVCLWGIADSNSHINGLYKYGGIYNNKPYYNKTSECNTLYIYWSESGKLKIDNVLGGDSSYYAYCDISSDPNNCDASWYIWSGNEWVIHSNVYTQSGLCPSWDCDQITNDIDSGGCHVDFDQHIGHNIWRSTANGRYWYFNPYYFRWSCYDEPMDISCPSASDSYYNKVSDGWTDLSKGQNIELDFIYPKIKTYTINCIGSPTLSPTNNPTVSPTNIPSSIVHAATTKNVISSISSISTSSNNVIITNNQQINGLDKLHLLLIIITVLISIIICMILIFCLAYFYKNGQTKIKAVQCEGTSITNSSINNSEMNVATDSVNKRNLQKLELEIVNSNSQGVAVNDILDKMNLSIPVNVLQPNIQQPGSAEIGGYIARKSSVTETKEGSSNLQPGSYPPEIDKLDDIMMVNYNMDNNDDANSEPEEAHSHHFHLDIDAMPEQTSTPNDTIYCTEIGDV